MELKKLKDCCKLQGGYAFKSREFVKDGYPIIRIGNIKENKVIVEKNVCYQKEFIKEDKNKQYIIEKGSLLIAMSGATVGKIGIYENNEIALLNQRVGKFICNDNFRMKYLYYWLKYDNTQKKILGKAIGCAQPNISNKQLEELYIPYYNIEKQDEIVYRLDKISQAINNRKETYKKNEELAESKFNMLFGDPIRNTKEFEFKYIKEVATIVSGTTPDTKEQDYWNGDIKWITPAEINEETFMINETSRKITKKGFKESGLKLMPKGTVIFSSRAPIGKTGITNVDMCCNQGFKNCICKKTINNIYLYYLLKINKEYFNSIGTGATFKEISKSVFENVKISIPPIKLQEIFAEFYLEIKEQQNIINQEIIKLEKLLSIRMQEYFKEK